MIYPQNFEQKIGFDQIRQLLKEKCLSTLGTERVEAMEFTDSIEDICEQLDRCQEFIRIIQEEDDFPDQYFYDLRPSLKRIRVEGMYMNEQELFDFELPKNISIADFKAFFAGSYGCFRKAMPWSGPSLCGGF